MLLSGRLRRTAIASGLILCLYSPPVALMYEGSYWSPRRIFGGDWGLEDVMFCFHVGAVSWLFAVWPWRDRIQFFPSVELTLVRLVTISALAIALLLCFLAAGIAIPSAFLLAQTASTAALLGLRPSFVRLLFPGTAVFITYYFLLLGLWQLMMPGFMDMWTGTDLGGSTLLGVPVEEWLWALSFCTGFSVTMAFVFDVKFDLERRRACEASPVEE